MQTIIHLNSKKTVYLYIIYKRKENNSKGFISALQAEGRGFDSLCSHKKDGLLVIFFFTQH